MATLSANGKRIGRPPKVVEAQPSAQEIAVAKALIHTKARYDAAGQGRRMAGWNPTSTGPNTAIKGLQTIRNRSRDASRNDWAGESTVETWTTNLVGIGITPRFRRIENRERRAEINDLLSDFVAECDADGVLNLYGMQTLAVRTWFDGGEAFIRRRYRPTGYGLAVPLQLQLLEPEMVPLLDADTYQGLPVNNRIRSGIEFDRRGRRVAYWFYKEHPGDPSATFTGTADELVRVLAEDVIHLFEPKRPGQLRGVSLMAPVLARLRNTGDYEDAVLERQKLANLWVGFISRSLPTLDPSDPNVNALSGLIGDSAPLAPLAPGLIQELEDGQTFNFANPPEAGTVYSDYLRTTGLGTAAGAGLPYELMSGDIRGVSDRTLRVIINDFRRHAEQRQWQIVIPQMCQRVIEWFAEASLLVGKIAVGEFDSVKRVEHAPHGWAYLHPVQDVQGKAMEVTNGFRSRSSVIGERGDDPDLVDEEREADMAREKKLGLPTAGVEALPEEDEDADDIPGNEYSAPPKPGSSGA